MSSTMKANRRRLAILGLTLALALPSAATAQDEPWPTHPVRLIAVQVEPHPRRTRKGTEHCDLILIATNLLDLPAELVALIYLYRYTVELFFRVFKQLLGMRHLLSQRQPQRFRSFLYSYPYPASNRFFRSPPNGARNNANPAPDCC